MLRNPHWTTFEWVLNSVYSFLFMFMVGHMKVWEILLLAAAVAIVIYLCLPAAAAANAVIMTAFMQAFAQVHL